MGCYLSILEVRDGKLYDRLARRWVDHEEVPTLTEEVIAQLQARTEKENANEKFMER